MVSKINSTKNKAIINSCLWAAYGDALGFITELTDKKGLEYRAGVEKIDKTIPWKRKIGGKFGVSITLPEGAYSDDTQLRLATCRAIRSDGFFDVEAFAKVELPVWLSYALGAGVGTKAAAASLSSPNVTWYSNFYSKTNTKYIDSGGNGAAMRIQPHVWSAKNLAKPETYMIDVIRNTICTHGHPHALFGSVFHAYVLGSVMQNNELPNIEICLDAIDFFNKVPEIISQDYEMDKYWLPIWEDKSNKRFGTVVKEIKKECMVDLSIIEDNLGGAPKDAYKSISQELGGMDKNTRGSGIKTALLASVLCDLFKNEGPNEALLASANNLQSDTDTIGTMAGALFGLVADDQPKGELQDRILLKNEAIRMVSISNSNASKESNFVYPDIIGWKAPKTQMDAVGKYQNGIAIGGLGYMHSYGKIYTPSASSNASWGWFELKFGQQIFCKFRKTLSTMNECNMPIEKNIKTFELTSGGAKYEISTQNAKRSRKIKDNKYKNKTGTESSQKSVGIDELSSEAIKSQFDPEIIGKHILLLTEEIDGVEKVIGYSSIIAKARRSRIKFRK